MPYQFFNCTVVEIIDESDVVKRFLIKFPDEVQFSFSAGQFVMLDLPVGGKEVDRSYSIASAPSDNNIFELVISLKQDGVGTNYLFHEVKVGAEIKVTKALGKFRLPEIIDTDICMICTGTGIAPLRSMLLHIFNRTIPHKNIVMIFGNRWIKDILYKREMEELTIKYPEFKFIPVLSRNNQGWMGREGYVHGVYEEMFTHRPPMLFYVCGWPEMVREARRRIEAMGYDKKNIKFELYD